MDATLADARAQLTMILQQLVTAAGRDAERIADVVLEGGELPFLTLAAGLNDVIREVAAASGAQVGELSGALDATQYVGGSDCLHPNPAGHAEIAEIIGDTLAR